MDLLVLSSSVNCTITGSVLNFGFFFFFYCDIVCKNLSILLPIFVQS